MSGNENKKEIYCIGCGRTCEDCGLDKLGVVEGIGTISLRELVKKRYEMWFVCQDCWHKREGKEKFKFMEIAALKAAGYEDKEITEMVEDEYNFEEVQNLVRRGHTKEEIENNFDELERKYMKEAGMSAAAIEEWQKEGVINHDL